MSVQLTLFDCLRRLVDRGWPGMTEPEVFAAIIAGEPVRLPAKSDLASMRILADRLRAKAPRDDLRCEPSEGYAQ